MILNVVQKAVSSLEKPVFLSCNIKESPNVIGALKLKVVGNE